jgi:O-antigen ligase
MADRGRSGARGAAPNATVEWWHALPLMTRAILGALAAVAAVLTVVVAGPVGGLIVLGGFVAILVVAELPGVLFAAYLLLATYKGAVQPASPFDITLILAVLNTLGIVAILRDPVPRRISQAGVLLWVALSLLILAGVLYAPDQDLGLDRAVRWWTLVLVPILVGGYRVGSDSRFLHQFVWTFYVMGLLTVGVGVTQLSSSQRLTVFETNTIQVARAALLVPLLGLTFVLEGSHRWARLATLVALPPALVVALASGSRGPLLVLLLLGVVGLVRLALRARSINWRLAGGALALSGATLISVSLVAGDLPGAAIERFGLLGDFVSSGLAGEGSTSTGDISAGTRVTLFHEAWSMFEARPVLGFGTSGFEAVAPNDLSPKEAEAWPHNALLQAAAEFGIVGLTIVLLLSFLTLIRRLPPDPAGSAIRLLFVFFFLNAMVSGDIFSDRETWGLLMLVLLIHVPEARNAPMGASRDEVAPPSRAADAASGPLTLS